MEIKMLECPNGHYYNAAVHANCPECDKRAVNVGYGSFPKTTPPDAIIGGQTKLVSRQDGSWASAPFSVPAVAGGNPADDSRIEPAVGWLVCVEGTLRGADFRLRDGYNYIGREEGDIQIHDDHQISRQKHAVVSFYAKRNSFHVGPADGRNIIELNGEPVFGPTEIKSYDILTIGSTKLMLVALCGDRFNWTEGVANE